MHLDNRGYVSIVQLIIYLPCWILGFIVCRRHGFKRSSGWIFILILSTIRIAGSICQLLTYSHVSEDLIKATAILDSIGIAPLLLTVLGVVSRFVDWINASAQSLKLNPRLFRVLQALIGVGLVLGILGVSIGSHSTNGIFVPSTTSRVGILVYIVDLVAITIVFVLSLSKVSALPRPERPLILHIPIALLAIAVRLLYAALCIFLHNSTFSLFSGSIVADILMAVVEEFFVVVITLVLGFKLDRISPSVQGEIIILNQKGRDHGRRLPESKDGIYAQPSSSGLGTFSSA